MFSFYHEKATTEIVVKRILIQRKKYSLWTTVCDELTHPYTFPASSPCCWEFFLSPSLYLVYRSPMKAVSAVTFLLQQQFDPGCSGVNESTARQWKRTFFRRVNSIQPHYRIEKRVIRCSSFFGFGVGWCISLDFFFFLNVDIVPA